MRLKGKKILLAMQPKSVLSPGVNGIQEGMMYHARKLLDEGADLTILSDMDIPGFEVKLYGREDEEGDFIFKIRKSRPMIDMAIEIAKLNELEKFDVIQIKGHFHMARGLELLKKSVGSTKVIGSFHNFSDVGISVIGSTRAMLEAINAGVKFDFLTKGNYENWWKIAGQPQSNLDWTADEAIEKLGQGDNINFLLNPVIQSIGLDELPEILDKQVDKIAYIGRMTTSKGVIDIMNFAAQSNCDVDLYGPVADEVVKNFLENDLPKLSDRVKYLGVLKQGKEATETMMKYKGLVIWSFSVDISNRSMIKAGGLGIPTLVTPGGLGNLEVAKMLYGEKYNDFIPQRIKKVMRQKDWVPQFKIAYDNIINMNKESRLELARKSREVFNIDKWTNDLVNLYTR